MFDVGRSMFDVQKNSPISYNTEFIRHKMEIPILSSYDTPSFAVESIASWWDMVGSAIYPANSSKALILADGGGSNSSRSRVWKCELQEKICSRYGIDITVCHYPPGCSKWNPIEHRLFSAISDNWTGVLLRSYEIMINHQRSR